MINLNHKIVLLVQTDFEFILGQNIPQSHWHDFDKIDLANWVREQLAHPAYYGSNATALKLQNEIVEYLVFVLFPICKFIEELRFFLYSRIFVER